jgi:hypothetical protein
LPAGRFGRQHLGAEVEPWIEVNPTNAANIVGIYQDRYSNGGSKGSVATVSVNGGTSWTQHAVPNDADYVYAVWDRLQVSQGSVNNRRTSSAWDSSGLL